MRSLRLVLASVVAVGAALFSAVALAAQTPEADPSVVTRLTAEPAELSLRVGDVVPLTVTAYDASGAVVDIPIRVSGPRRVLRIRDGSVEAYVAGQYEVQAMVVMPASGAPVAQLTIPVVIDWPEVAAVEVDAGPDMMYAGSTVRYAAAALHADGSARPFAEVNWSVSDSEVATVDAFGNVTAHQPGPVTVTALVEGRTRIGRSHRRALPGHVHPAHRGWGRPAYRRRGGVHRGRAGRGRRRGPGRAGHLVARLHAR